MTIRGPSSDYLTPALSLTASAGGISEAELSISADVGVRPAAPPLLSTKPQIDTRALRDDIARQLEDFLRESGRSLEFRVDESAHTTVITVRRADTGEIVRQYPTEEALTLLRRLNERSGTLLEALA
jgi:FlaG protein